RTRHPVPRGRRARAPTARAPRPAHPACRPPAGDLQTALSSLSPEQRTCWVLRELDGQSYEFIADAVGISQEAVRARVFRARRCLTQELGAWR
ncbi:sigma factor-like helix-turn-helix DNA-binding protein, partial [Streptomyces sp. NPDC059814]|uniref:sigma factor-like helix-turn-helix DNA-binding protein n=1 Tax=Streptomyces sp. NPDC059814 TaxID=3346959 RepID=UPI00364BC017